MNRNKPLLILIMLLSLGVVFTAVYNLFGTGRQYIDTESEIVAATADLNNIFSPQDNETQFEAKIEQLTEYCKSNGINTVIIPFNSQHNAIADTEGFVNSFNCPSFMDDNDILKAIKRPLDKADIQLVLELECSILTSQQIKNGVAEINSRFAPAGILLKNYYHSFSELQTIKHQINKKFRDYYFGIRLENISSAEEIAAFGAVDFYIFDSITDTEYKDVKNGFLKGERVLLNHKADNFLNSAFILANFGGFDGAVITDYTLNPEDLSLYHNLTDVSLKPHSFDFRVDSSFIVTNPSADIKIYDEGIYVMGTADPAQPVYINSAVVQTAQDGSFGHFVNLAEGENTIEIIQGTNHVIRVVTREKPQNSYKPKQHDDTKKAKSGQIVQTTETLTSMLIHSDSDAKIREGLQQGVQLVVDKSVRTERNGEYTWAYQLSNGDYVLAADVQWVDKEDYIPCTVGQISVEKLSNGDEYLNIQATGKPAVVTYDYEKTVVFEIIDAQLSQQHYNAEEEKHIIALNSAFGNECTVETINGSVYIFISKNDNMLWGYNTEYTQQNVIKIYLKNAPEQQSGAKPLEGVSVIVDAGHGGSDPGALALGGINGPQEKDLNLAVALAAGDCLERLGAEVTYTRTEDVFVPLQQRRDITNSIKPDLFISVHHNSLAYSADGAEGTGVESYYFTPQSEAVAQHMAQSVSAATQRVNRGHYNGRYYVLRNDIAPCVLNEYGFMNNPLEYSELYSDREIYKAAIGTALAVLEIIPE